MSGAPSERAPLGHLLLATLGGVGFAPWAPGTAGTLATVPIYALACHFHLAPWLPLVALILAAVGIWSGGIVAKARGEKDPSCIVIDEAAGYLLACCFGPPGWRTGVLAFCTFRLLDATKPRPIARLEALPGGWGVMADDVGAGLLAGSITWLSWALIDGSLLGVFGAPG